jgi:TatD DNase family protein
VISELFDTHAHLDDESFCGILPQLLRRAEEDGVGNVLTIGICLETSQNAVAIARQHRQVRAVVGIQPNTCGDCKSGDWAEICQLAQDPTVVALGETGLDLFWDRAPLDLQQDYFDRHLRLSQEMGLPFVVHMRDCQQEILIMLREARRRGGLRGVMHSFTGDKDGAMEAVEMGLHISFAGMVTFKKSDELRDVAAAVPDNRILIETDSPYLSPHPHRGKRPNEPARVLHTARCLAEVRGVPFERFAAQTTENAKSLFLS